MPSGEDTLSGEDSLVCDLVNNVRSFTPNSTLKYPAKLGTPTSTLRYPVKLTYLPTMATLNTVTPAHAVSMDKSEAEIFTVSRKTVPSSKSVCRKRISLDDNTYILATGKFIKHTYIFPLPPVQSTK